LEIREIHNYLIDIENQMINLLNSRDLLQINFDSCSLTGDIRIYHSDLPFPRLEQSNNDLFDLNQMKLIYQLKTFSNETSPLGVSSYRTTNSNSSQIFVTCDQRSTLIIFDFDEYLIKRINIEPSFDFLNDIIWCDYLNLFLLAGSALFSFNYLTNQIHQISICSNPQIWSITTHKYNSMSLIDFSNQNKTLNCRTSLYICYIMGEFPLIEHRSLPSFNLIESFSRLQVLPTENASTIEIGRTIRTNGSCLAITVRNLHTGEWRVDLFDFDLQRIIQGEILGYAIDQDYWCCSLTSYRSSHWLIMNNTSQPETLTLINRYGQIQQQIERQGFNLVVCQDNRHLVIKDRHGLAIFQI